MTTNGPDPRAAAKGFLALVLDMARIDPHRRPTPDMVRWYRELSSKLGASVTSPASNRDLLDAALRLESLAHRAAGDASPDRSLEAQELDTTTSA
jgi:hypothetical protein